MGRLKLKGAPPKYARPYRDVTSQLTICRNLKKVKKIEKAFQVAKEPAVEEDEVEPEGWVMVESLEDLVGPLVLISSGGQLVSLSETGVPSTSEIDVPAEAFEPGHVSQVLVGKMLLPGVFCLQSAYKRYLTSDPIGIVSASKEAVGPAGRWTPEYLGDGQLAFQSAFGKYLAVGDQGMALRADSVEAGDAETFSVKCQAMLRWERNKSRAQPATSPEDALDLKALRRQHAFQPGKKISSDLLEAQRQGRLNEALLDRRVRKKHDKYC